MESPYEILVFFALLAPLVSFITIGLTAGPHPRLVHALALSWAGAGFLASVIVTVALWGHPALIELSWFRLGDADFSADLAISNRSLIMLSTVSAISLLVHLYSTLYMSGDEEQKRYFAMLGFFTFSMQGIVLSDNLLLLFVFWELVGFSSYMLIGHWTRKPEAGRAATKAFVMNRIGDAGFLVGLMMVWRFHETFSLTSILGSPEASVWATAASVCIFFGVIGKSAQFPLFTWLPDAMEGPTPVSALIHAATMVAAGVYLLVRVFPLFTEPALLVVAVTGMITTLMGALAALSQYDIKKILAYSTMSQLGLMILALGMGVVDAALLHLLTHAFFKACLFLSAGMIIHSIHHARPASIYFNEQDIRNMGGLRKNLPVTYIAFLLSGASLAGVPFFSGFISKEAILTALVTHTNILSWLMIVVIISVSFITVMYTFRLISIVFHGAPRTVRALDISEPGWQMRVPVTVLAACSLWIAVSWNPFDFKGWMMPSAADSSYSTWITVFSTLWVLAALVLSWKIFRKSRFRTNAILRNAFYTDHFYSRVSEGSRRAATSAAAYVDRNVLDRSLHGLIYAQVVFAHVVGWIDRTIVDGTVNATARVTGLGGKFTRSFQGGNIQLYIFWSVLAIIIFIIWALN